MSGKRGNLYASPFRWGGGGVFADGGVIGFSAHDPIAPHDGALPYLNGEAIYLFATSTFQKAIVEGGRIQPLVRALTAEALYHSPSG